MRDVKGQLFQDLRILFTFLGEKEKYELQETCTREGAVVLSAVTHNDPPHVIVTRRVGSPKYSAVLRRHPRTPVVSPEWIQSCVDQQKRVAYSQYGVGVCYGLKVCLSGFSTQDKAKLAALVQKEGGLHSASLTKQCTHLICASSEGEKYRFAQKHGIACVGPTWLTEGSKSGWCKEDTQYPVRNPVEMGLGKTLGGNHHHSLMSQYSSRDKMCVSACA